MIGAGQVLGSFQARLGLDSSDYAKGIINAESVSRIFGQTFATFVSNPLLGSIDILKKAGGAFITASQQILANAESVERLSQQTGASIPLLISMTKQLELAGFNAERSQQSFVKLNQFIRDLRQNGPLSNEVLKDLNINLQDLQSTDDIFRALLEGMSKIENEALRSAIAARIFGEEAGPQLINAVGGGNAAIDEMIQRYTDLGFVVDDMANAKLASLNTNLGLVQQAWEGIKQSAVREFMLGAAGDIDVTTESIQRQAKVINDQLNPASREAGELTSAWVAGLAELLPLVNDFYDILGNLIAPLMNAADNDHVITLNGLRAKTGYESRPELRSIFDRNRQRGQEYLESEMGL